MTRRARVGIGKSNVKSWKQGFCEVHVLSAVSLSLLRAEERQSQESQVGRRSGHATACSPRSATTTEKWMSVGFLSASSAMLESVH